MGLKNINFKQLLLEKGEKIGLAVLGGIAILLVLIYGVSALTGNNSPGDNVAALNQLKNQAETAHRNSKPPADLEQLPPELQAVEMKHVDAESFPTPRVFFNATESDDRKWRIPKVLPPDEFHAVVHKGAIQAYRMEFPAEGKPKVYVFSERGAAQAMTNEQLKLLQERLGRSNRRALQSQRPQLQTPANPNVPPAPPGGGGKGGGGLPSPGGELRGVPGAREGQSVFDGDLRAVELDKVEANARLAQTNLPRRMIIVTGAFPYKQQLEEYRKAMRYGSIEEMLADPSGAQPEFLGFNVQRRKYNPEGKLIDDWTDIDVHADMRRLRMQAVDTVPEDPRLQALGIIVFPNRIVQPLPLLAREEKYPEARLPSIEKTQAEMQGAPPPPPPPQKSRFDVDLYDQKAAPAPAGTTPTTGGKQGGVTSPGAVAQNIVSIPEKCLLRFVDTDPKLTPGFSYEYRVQILMSNPCKEKPERAISKRYGDKEFVEGPWQEVTWSEDGNSVSRITVPSELRYYVVDEKTERSAAMANQDRAFVQIHRWIEGTEIKAGEPIPVGDWSILPRREVHRGEYVGKVEESEVPTWNPAYDRFMIAVQPSELRRGAARVRRLAGIAVDFATDLHSQERKQPLVVDFEGGEHTMTANSRQIRESGPVEMLILTADNRLIVRNSKDDGEDKTRKERVDAWKAWVDRVRAQGFEEKKKDDNLFTPPGGAPGKGGGAPGGG